MKAKQRHSGMELLRIIAMMMVVMVHTDFWALGEPRPALIDSEPLKAFSQYLVESFAIICVNCFIFISGWFSIKPTVRGFVSLLFQIIFYNVLIYLVCALTGYVQFDIRHFATHLNFLPHWFLISYIALYLLAPIFNVFVEKSSPRQALITMSSFTLLDVVFGWFVDYLHFTGGYTLLHLMVIYVIARYIRVHGGKLFKFDKKIDMGLFLAISIITPIFVMVSYYVARPIWNHIGLLFLYNSPFIIITSVYFSLFFTKLKLKSNFVGFIGASSFAVYLIHTDVLVRNWCIRDFCRTIFFNYSILYYSMAVILLIISLFVVAISVDLVRKKLWHLIQSHVF